MWHLNPKTCPVHETTKTVVSPQQQSRLNGPRLPTSKLQVNSGGRWHICITLNTATKVCLHFPGLFCISVSFIPVDIKKSSASHQLPLPVSDISDRVKCHLIAWLKQFVLTAFDSGSWLPLYPPLGWSFPATKSHHKKSCSVAKAGMEDALWGGNQESWAWRQRVHGYSPGTPEPWHARAGSFINKRSHNLLGHVGQHSKSGFHDEINETWAEIQAESGRQEEDLCGVTASAIGDSNAANDRVKKLYLWKRDRQILERENRVTH